MTELLCSPKIKPEHLARKAIVYLRQSSDKQVRQNLESQRLQYEVAERTEVWDGGMWRSSTVILAPVPEWRRRAGKASNVCSVRWLSEKLASLAAAMPRVSPAQTRTGAGCWKSARFSGRSLRTNNRSMT